MIIEYVSVIGLFGKSESYKFHLNRDLNIITGRNGSGKTTILKLAWFILSGNISHALKEVVFKSCTVKTDKYKCIVTRVGHYSCTVEMRVDDDLFIFEDDEDPSDFNPFGESAEDKAKPFLVKYGSSMFFPTFRRIEGGFSLVSDNSARARHFGKASSDIDEALSSLSTKLTNGDHTFVAAISTQDINSLLLKRYASFSEEVNSYQQFVSKNVIDKIKKYQRTKNNRIDADSLLSETREEIEKIEEFRNKTMLPLEAVRKLVESLFQHSGISFGKRLNFGDAAEAVNSDKLSAGEKQMLSFICYNAFNQNSVIFIDEPELSLHVDWQRQLCTILQNQNPTNQFIFATHSPFIYGKYPDKEVFIGADRGE